MISPPDAAQGFEKWWHSEDCRIPEAQRIALYDTVYGVWRAAFAAGARSKLNQRMIQRTRR